MSLQNFEAAIDDFNAVLLVDPNNKAAKNQILVANQKIALRRQHEKKQFGGLFDRLAQAEAKEAEAKVCPSCSGRR